jgi:hypothetical protein
MRDSRAAFSKVTSFIGACQLVNAQILLRETSIVYRAGAARLSFVDLRVLGG